MTNIDQNLSGPVWHYFGELLRIPRASGFETEATQYIVSFAREHGLECEVDAAGNVVVRKGATAEGYRAEPLLLQAHLDMVCVGKPGCTDDPAQGQITPRTFTDNEGRLWLAATDTTLGADDGIGVALCLALLADQTLCHGPLTCLFTTDEERGLTGAEALSKDFLCGSALINLDSEDEGEIYIGCAGGCTAKARKMLATQPSQRNMTLGLRLRVSGLKGGHSGGDIHLGRANAIKLMARMVDMLAAEYDFALSEFHGGRVHNAIPSECEAVGMVPFRHRETARIAFNIMAQELEEEYEGIEDSIHFELETDDVPSVVLMPEEQEAFLRAVLACPHGVMEMSGTLAGVVKTSMNLAVVELNGGEARIVSSQRSQYESSKRYAQQMVMSVLQMWGAEVETTDGYPGWQPNMRSALLGVASQSYKSLFGTEAAVKCIHAGLECGLFASKVPGLDMISVGPTVRDVHSIAERVDVGSVGRFWTYITDIVGRWGKDINT